MVWYIVGMVLECKDPLYQTVNRLDIMLLAYNLVNCQMIKMASQLLN
ncbi:hypothetical protein PEC301875_27790 [Pectobacterium carotovorum subsp. carotovorum]|nr:hypothetical protein PEC301875_27790 [Pectobacterium carotovorum subsp. carotovorum]